MNNPPTLTQWRELYDIAARLKEMAPWDWLYDSDLFGVQDPESGEIGYCCVLGAGGEEFGLAVYPGSAGLMSYLQIAESANDPVPPDDLIFMVNCLRVAFDDREYVEDPDREVMKKLGLKFRGRNNWIIFRSYIPGYHPWFINQKEAAFLINILEEALRVCEKYRENPDDLHPRTNNDEIEIMVRMAWKSGSLKTWDTHWQIPEEPQPDYVIPPVDHEKLRKLGKDVSFRKTIWEFDAWYFPNAVKDDNDSRPYFPKMLIWADQQSGMIIEQDMVRQENFPEAVHRSFYNLLETGKTLPSEIWVADFEIMAILEPLCKAAKIQIDAYEALPGIDSIRAFMMNQLF